MTENQLLGSCLYKLRPAVEGRGGLVFKHADSYSTGVPDVSVTLGKSLLEPLTSWWEFKRQMGNEKLSGTALQHQRMLQLARHGVAFYVVYRESDQSAYIAQPRFMLDGRFSETEATVCGSRVRHSFVVDFIMNIHLGALNARTRLYESYGQYHT